jgi:hypothetical protein
VIATVCCVVPPLFVSVKVIVSVYVPVPRSITEVLTVTLCDVAALKLPLVGLTLSQLEPLAVEADHEPSVPQLLNVTVWGAGSLCPAVALKVSDAGLT